MKMFLNSIGKKIFVIVFLAMIIVLFLIFVSLTFFGKIAETGGIKEAAFKYEVLTKNAAIEFEKFTNTNDKNHYSKAVETLTLLTTIDDRMGKLHELIEEGNSPKQAVEIYRRKTGDNDSAVIGTANFINFLMGSPLITNLVDATNRAHVLTADWKQLLVQYQTESNPSAREKLITRVREIEDRMPAMLATFHGAMGDVANHLSGQIRMMFMIVCAVAILLISVVAFFISRTITVPLKQTVKFIRKVSDGDFKGNLEIKSSDELGVMVDNMNRMSGSLRDMIKEIISGITQLNTSSDRLIHLSEQVSNNAGDNADKANSVSVAAEEMSTNMNSVAAAMEQSSVNINTVASAAEEMNATINEIAQNAETARVTTLSAVGKAGESTEMMNGLSGAAEGIGKVVETITDISEQVNLLSLNATIEAARAGEAGKGFAVVANEIKDLAKQTSEASLDIKEKIENIQESSKVSLSSIEAISSVIADVNDIVATIATAVEEQSAATCEISQNISQASSGIEEVSENVSECTMVVGDITKDISAVDQSSNEISQRSEDTRSSAKDLAQLAVRLDKMIGHFQI